MGFAGRRAAVFYIFSFHALNNGVRLRRNVAVGEKI
jgi:hypothetical protein